MAVPMTRPTNRCINSRYFPNFPFPCLLSCLSFLLLKIKNISILKINHANKTNPTGVVLKERIMSDDEREDSIIVFMDLSIEKSIIGRVKIELSSISLNKLSQRFYHLCIGSIKTAEGIPIGYKSANIHRISGGRLIEGGDFIHEDGTGIYQPIHDYETNLISNNKNKKIEMGSVSLNPHSGSIFSIHLSSNNVQDDENPIIGRVIEGMGVLRRIEQVSMDQGYNKLKFSIIISECGQL